MAEAKETLSLLATFPPVTTAEWEAVVQRDLKGADYDKRLKWRTDEGIVVKPYYRAEDAPQRDPWVRGAGQPWEMAPEGREPALSVNAIVHHEQGATAVEEVALALAECSDRLAAGQPVETIGFATGSNYFMEIAKLRAVRMLFANLAAAYGTPAAPVKIHCRTAAANKTLYDPYVNLLRVTTEALSAVVGGCDTLTIAAARFDAHLAPNVQRILREESHLDKVADPAAGSYYVEALTDALAAEAWKLFQSIEAAGGFAAWRGTGALEALLKKSREAKEKAVGSRRRTLVGTNNYPNTNERVLDGAAELPGTWRLGGAFEAIRLRTERHAKATGMTPKVLLLEHGDLKMRKARATFCQNFFGCAGFSIAQAESLEPADLVVLCSSDAEYLELAKSVCSQVKAPVVVAGNPKDTQAALEAAGVAGFVHVLSNAVETLTLWQDKLGVGR